MAGELQMIQKVRVRNYKALRDVEVSLGPINLLIGPNDSGKTSFLEVIGAMCRSVDQPLSSAFAGSWSGLDLVSDRDPERAVELEAVLTLAGARTEYGFSCTFRPHERLPLIQAEKLRGLAVPTAKRTPAAPQLAPVSCGGLADHLQQLS
jgi:predicted ATPase